MIIENFIKGIELKYKNHYFSGLCFDSTKCKKDNIFFAIKGTEIDGNKFINHAIQMGAKTIVSNQKFEGFKRNILFIKSYNVRKIEHFLSKIISLKIPAALAVSLDVKDILLIELIILRASKEVMSICSTGLFKRDFLLCPMEGPFFLFIRLPSN